MSARTLTLGALVLAASVAASACATTGQAGTAPTTARTEAAASPHPATGGVQVPEPGSGAWGPGDEVGAANRLNPQLVLDAAKLVTTGRVYSLGMAVDRHTPAYGHRGFQLRMMQPENPDGRGVGPTALTYNDELVEAWMGVGTQLNGLGHVGIDNVYYNGHRAEDFVTVNGLTRLGLEKVPPIVTRGVLLDMAAHFGTDIVPAGRAFTAADIEAAAARQGVSIRTGDVVLFHTGWLNLVGKDNQRYLSGGPGINRDAAALLAGKGVVAVGSDTWALEVVPGEPGAGTFEVNQFLLARNGIYVLENIHSADLAKDRAYEFLFALGHPKYAGAAQSIINPIAIR